jgi:hypothetical protein
MHLLKKTGKRMHETEIREELEALQIHVQPIMQLRSRRWDEDAKKDRPLTPHLIVLARGQDVSKLRSLAELCGLRAKVDTYNAPKGPLQWKNCQSFTHTLRNCGYAPRCVPWGDAHLCWKCVTPKQQL